MSTPNDFNTMIQDCTWMVVEAITKGEPLRTAIQRVIVYVRACDREAAALAKEPTP